METKHTVGKWIKNGNNGVHTPTGECIAITYGDNRSENAKLIASAPELLDALIKIKACITCTDSNHQIVIRIPEELAQQLHKTINKATE